MSKRILQITDCHIVTEQGERVHGTNTFESLQAVLEAALRLQEPPDMIVATGDLSEDGSEGSYRRLRRLLLETRLPVCVIAGNHDSVVGVCELLAGGAIKLTRSLDLGSWRLVFIDSRVEGQPHGLLAESDLEFLAGACGGLAAGSREVHWVAGVV